VQALINTKAAAPTRLANATLLATMLDRVRVVRGVTAASYARRPVQSFWSPEPIGAAPGTAATAGRRIRISFSSRRATRLRLRTK
jgi:hypothetical protein